MNLDFKIKNLLLICLIFLGVFNQYYSQTQDKKILKQEQISRTLSAFAERKNCRSGNEPDRTDER
jgi:hypothetical protein